MTIQNDTTLILGGTGKTGRRVASRLQARGLPVRIASRSGSPAFDWADRATWRAALEGVRSIYLAYYPDLAVPNAADDIRALTALAVKTGVQQVVLLSGRGEEQVLPSERAVQECGAAFTILRAAWFAQNFSEDFLAGSVAVGEVFLPAPDVVEPFVDADDLADVAVAALTDPQHQGQTYEVTGPELLTFAEAAATIAGAIDRPVRVTSVSPADYVAGAVADGVPEPLAAMLADLFVDILDGRNAHLGDGTDRALGRPARPFAAYAERAAAEGAWAAADAEVVR